MIEEGKALNKSNKNNFYKKIYNIDYSKKLVAPSTDPVKVDELSTYIPELIFAKADLLHVDIMDGIFVKRKTYDFRVPKILRKRFDIPLDIHLMIDNPKSNYKKFLSARPQILTVEYEAFEYEEDMKKVLKGIRKAKIKSGIAIAPETEVSKLTNFLDYVDSVTIMGVTPGASGQKLDESVLSKINELNDFKKKFKKDLIIEFDGGVNNKNASDLYNRGVNVLISGSYVYNMLSRRHAINMLKGIDTI
jgi:ribulose-phosphate 3-epimerase